MQTHFFIQQQTRAHEGALRQWLVRTRSQTTLPAMARMATHPPAPGALVRGMGTTRADTQRATSSLEPLLLERVATTTASADLQLAQRLLGGHFPRVVHAIQARLRAL